MHSARLQDLETVWLVGLFIKHSFGEKHTLQHIWPALAKSTETAYLPHEPPLQGAGRTELSMIIIET